MLATKLLMCTFDEVFGFKSAELMKCLQGRSLTQFATKNIGCFVYELNRESDYTDKNNVLLFVQEFFQIATHSGSLWHIAAHCGTQMKIYKSDFKKMLTISSCFIAMKRRGEHLPRKSSNDTIWTINRFSLVLMILNVFSKKFKLEKLIVICSLMNLNSLAFWQIQSKLNLLLSERLV